MKKSVKRLLAGSAAAAAAAVVWKNRESPKLEPVFDQAKKCLYRANSLVMDTAIKLIPGLFPLPRTEIGCGSRKLLPQVLKELGISHVMVVTGPSIGKRLVPPIVEDLENQGIACTVFAETEANPSVTTVESIRSLYLDAGCDGFLAIGGGSPMDAAKVAAARIAKPHTPIGKMAGTLRVLAKLPPVVCVPTTAGTGSETTLAAVITDSETHYKYPINDFALIPDYAVLDAELTVGLPPQITATTGMDALTHAVEAYIGRSTNRLTRAMAEEAVALIAHNLQTAYRDGGNLEARQRMLRAAYCAGIAFTRSYVGYVHGIAHSLGGQYGIAHGLANAVILPHMLRRYGTSCSAKLARLAEIAGLVPPGTDENAAAERFIDWVESMNASFSLPTGFAAIREEDIPQMARRADRESNPLYPVPMLMDQQELEAVYHELMRKEEA